MNNPKQLNYTQQLEHRLSQVQDDLNTLRRFINEQGLDVIFQRECSATMDAAIHNLNNIEIACDLNDDESLSWGMF